MKEINAFQTSDGLVFTSERSAEEHQQDIIGVMLDGLVPDDDRGNVTRVDRHNILTKMIKDPTLGQKILALHNALSHGE